MSRASAVFLLTQAQLDEYIRRLEEAERNLRTAEAKIAERDQRIVEVERLLSCMGMVRRLFDETRFWFLFELFFSNMKPKTFYRRRANSSRSCRSANSVSVC